jgi:CheY-like chemotaxis protein
MERVLHILHADDDEEDRWIFQDGVNDCNPTIQLTQFEDGLHLLKYIQTIQPDPKTLYAIICDMQMPLMDGVGVLSQVKAMPGWRAVPFIIFSTSSFIEDIRQCMNKGALAFYTKPVTFPDCQRIIKEMIQCCQKQVASTQLSFLR